MEIIRKSSGSWVEPEGYYSSDEELRRRGIYEHFVKVIEDGKELVVPLIVSDDFGAMEGYDPESGEYVQIALI